MTSDKYELMQALMRDGQSTALSALLLVEITPKSLYDIDQQAALVRVAEGVATRRALGLPTEEAAQHAAGVLGLYVAANEGRVRVERATALAFLVGAAVGAVCARMF